MSLTTAWTPRPEGLCRGDLTISFQRFSCPPSGVISWAPSSLGALPVAAAHQKFLLPVYPEEAFWIGVTSHEPSPSLTLRVHRGEAVRQLRLKLDKPLAMLPGIPRSDGKYDVFSVGTMTRLDLEITGVVAEITPVDPQTYASLSHEPAPPPLRPDSGFRGWLLP